MESAFFCNRHKPTESVQMSRVVILVDMDCFYAQVEQRENPSLWSKPVGVLQYSAQGQSGLIAVSYEARAYGVKRGMTAKQCKELCPDIAICLVPQGEHADKADIQKYRDASAEVFSVLGSVDPRVILERASVDEAFLDCTVYVEAIAKGEKREHIIQRLLDPACLPTSFIVDGEEEEKDDVAAAGDVDEETREKEQKEKEMRRRKKIEEFIEKCRTDDECLKIALAAELAERLREKVKEKTQFYCSAGVGRNKMMAKLVCAAHKPRKQSFIPPGSEIGVLRDTPIRSIRGLGGKLGSTVSQKLGISKMGELGSLPAQVVSAAFPEQAEWLMRIATGVDNEPVKARTTQTSIGVGKNFPGKLAISTTKDARFWLEGLTKELNKRLAFDKLMNRRMAQNIVVHLTTDVSTSKTVRVGADDEKEERLLDKLWPVLLSLRKGQGEDVWHPPIVNIGLSAGKFLEGLPPKDQSILGWIEKRGKELKEIAESRALKRLARSKDVTAKMMERMERGEGGWWLEELEEEEVVEVEQEEQEEQEKVYITNDHWMRYDDECSILEEEEEPGTSMSGPLRRPAVVQIEESAFELDDEGWQVWPSSSAIAASPPSSLPPPYVSSSAPSTVPSTVPSEVDETSRAGTESRCSIDETSRESGRKREEKRKVGGGSGSEGVSNSVLMELPENIRLEVIHMEKLREAKELKEKRAQKEVPKTKQQPQKRKGAKEEKEETKKSKPISHFFGGKTNK